MRKFCRNIIGGILVLYAAVVNIGLEAAATVTFPANTPKRVGVIAAGAVVPMANNPGDQFTHIQIPTPAVGGNADIYFPVNGNQPKTRQAARWSCANVQPGILNSPITDWYMEMFGWVNPAAGAAPPMGFAPLVGVPVVPGGQGTAPIITLDPATMTAPGLPAPVGYASRAAAFWGSFRTMASDPVGRVRLYRLLMEIRRQDAGNIGRCGDGINPGGETLFRRNQCRSIRVVYSWSGCAFVQGSREIRVDPIRRNSITVRINAAANTIDTATDAPSPLDVGLYHEMGHWYRFLRHPVRYFQETIYSRTVPTQPQYVEVYYYGNTNSEYRTWGGIDNEEIANILGIPDCRGHELVDLLHPDALRPTPPPGGGIQIQVPYCRCFPFFMRTWYLPIYYEGDNESENVYRISRSTGVAGGLRMRFGHSDAISPVSIAGGIPPRFRLAHLTAARCYEDIVGHAPVNWNLVSGQAAQ
ncbi:MAG: hypothetical protein LBM19_01865 [Holosporales bacterium]|nr:hypothetical protein [Holosporales bacterium]